MRMQWHIRLVFSTILVILIGSTPLRANQILVFGDSWAAPIGEKLQEVLAENDNTAYTVITTPFWEKACTLNAAEGLEMISDWLDRYPQTDIVHLSIGANDLFHQWSPDLADTLEEAAILTQIVNCVEIVADHIFSVRPHSLIVWSSYDFFRPFQYVWRPEVPTPPEINAIHIKLAKSAAAFALSKHPNFFYVNIYGTFQLTYGFDGNQRSEYDPPFTIPPGDPSLPNPDFPSPHDPFPKYENTHPTPEGYKVLAQAQYDRFYASLFDEHAFHINSGHAGAWFNPATSGQGQLIDIEPDKQFIFLSWFAFTDATSANPNEQHWFTAQGNYSGKTADLVVHETLGGRFDDPQETNSESVGEISLRFMDCGFGQVSYSIEKWDLQGTFPLQRAIPGTENVCQERVGITAEGLNLNDVWDGAWFDEDTPGQGFLIDVRTNPDGDDFIFVSWFTYGESTASGQRWLTAQGPLAGSTAEIVVYETVGGGFVNSELSETSVAGSMTIDFTDCSNALLTYSMTDETLAGTIDLKRAIPGTEALCEELTGSE